MRLVEVAPGRPQKTRARGPAAAAQHLVRAEPGLRVLLIWVGDEARIGLEPILAPLPDVAVHLPAAEGAVAVRVRGDVDGAAGAPIEIGVGELGAGRGALPFGLAGQAAAGELAIRLRLMPAHVEHRFVRLERHPAIEHAALPAVLAPPVERRLGARGVDEAGELALRDRRASDAEIVELH